MWPPDAKSWLTGKDPDAGEYWRQEANGATDDYRLNMDILGKMQKFLEMCKLQDWSRKKEKIWKPNYQ